MSKKRRFGWYALSISIALSLLLCSPPVFGEVDWEVGRDGWGSERDNWGRGRGGGGEPEPDPDPDPYTKKVISDVPEYFHPPTLFNSCAPTAGGMLVGFWDAQPGYGNLWEGDISYWETNGVTNQLVIDVISSVADFMKWDPDGTAVSNIAPGLIDFAAWDGPNKDDYGFVSDIFSDFTFDVFREEIDKGYPMLLGVPNHAVAAYGYDTSNEFFAVWDTWGTNQIEIEGYDPSGAYTDADGIEWWPYSYVDLGVYFQPDGEGALAHTPEPKSFLLIGIGLLAIIGWHKKRQGKKTI